MSGRYRSRSRRKYTYPRKYTRRSRINKSRLIKSRSKRYSKRHIQYQNRDIIAHVRHLTKLEHKLERKLDDEEEVTVTDLLKIIWNIMVITLVILSVVYHDKTVEYMKAVYNWLVYMWNSIKNGIITIRDAIRVLKEALIGWWRIAISILPLPQELKDKIAERLPPPIVLTKELIKEGENARKQLEMNKKYEESRNSAQPTQPVKFTQPVKLPTPHSPPSPTSQSPDTLAVFNFRELTNAMKRMRHTITHPFARNPSNRVVPEK